ncbi:MAG TPA: LysM peptidoglycan-binding domain-containing protein [Bacteroidetes bacterium]|nr:LysM peptidoglycan-binding domain-containing protein [Bacteroidota bacterium]
MRVIPYILLLALLISSCHSARWSRTGTLPAGENPAIENYIKEYADLAMDEMRRTGVPASITLAQAAIESDYGRSRLALAANNHFGIKCHNGWKGRRIYHNDDRRGECFRRYRDVSESFRDHSDFLVQGSRYNFLFYLKQDDYRGWARGLKSAGYATNPRYADMLIDMIEKNDLHVYDQMVIGSKRQDQGKIYATLNTEKENGIKKTTDVSARTNLADDDYIIGRGSRVKVRNMVEYITISGNDTFDSLAGEFGLFSRELYMFNDLDDDAELREGQILYLHPKRNRAERGKEYHIVKEGETMHGISQLYGIRLRALYRKNRMEPGYEPPPGTELWLRKLKPEGL